MNLPVLTYTNLNDYRICPRRFFHKHVAKDCPKEQKTGQQNFGNEVHDALRKRLKLREPLPAKMENLETICHDIEIRDAIRYFEQDLAITFNGKACGHWDKDVWLRVRADVIITNAPVGVLVDWKTGKPWEDPFELALQALCLRAHRPELTCISGFYVWLKIPKVGKFYTDEVNDTARTMQDVQRIHMSMQRRLKDNDWPPDENPLCSYCPVGAKLCTFWRERPK